MMRFSPGSNASVEDIIIGYVDASKWYNKASRFHRAQNDAIQWLQRRKDVDMRKGHQASPDLIFCASVYRNLNGALQIKVL